MKIDASGDAQGWVIWFVGLPGAGKSTFARAVCEALHYAGRKVSYLSMDSRRGVYFPLPQYTHEERAEAYRLFAHEAAHIARTGRNVIMDGTAPELSMREYARRLVPHFAEVYVSCPVEVAMRREQNRAQGTVMAHLYRKALERQRTGVPCYGLGEVVGVDVPFEENPAAECTLDSDQIGVEEGRDRVLELLARWQDPGTACAASGARIIGP